MSGTCGYSGHGARTGGLQGHSVGEMYPYTVIGLGNGWAAFDTRSGSTGNRQPTYNLALMDVCSARLRNMMHS